MLFAITFNVRAQLKTNDKIWFKTPADALVKDNLKDVANNPEWLKALPVGNGFLGAMVFGDVNKERIQLNEKSLWSGSPQDSDNPDAGKYLAEIRALLFAGEYKKATELTNKTQVCKGAGSGHGNGANVPFGCFQTLGDLWLDFKNENSFQNYHRELDLTTGISLTRYTQNGITFTREIFASNLDRALIIRLTADKPNAITFQMALTRPERFKTTVEGNKLLMQGAMDNGKGGDGMQYKTYATPILTGGKVETRDNGFQITNATAVTIVVTAATDYRLHYPDYVNNTFATELDQITKKAISKNYTLLKSQHIKDFSSYMFRSSLKLGNAKNDLPTNELLLKNHETKNELGLYELYYQYGRYLLLSSSRKGSLPANLQGIWANQIQTPWNGDYHTDINVQMNYWPAEITNLSECNQQLIDLINCLQEPGKKTARVQYGMKGWVLHPITNVWGYTSPGEHPSWGMHVGAGGWISQHLWERYAFTNNKKYLASAYPSLKQASLFYLDWLVKDVKTGKLVSGPSASPENTFKTPDGGNAQISMGPAHDQEVIYELFTNTAKAAKILNVNDDEFLTQLRDATANLARPKVASDGRLMEWAEEFKEAEPTHRHISHLYAVYPGKDISVNKTPELAMAAKKSLNARTDNGTGWSLAWKIALWTRLRDGDRALKLLNDLLKPVTSSKINMSNGGGTFANLFCAHPPFQIDGNFGATAGIAEMLLQSHEDVVELLPSLPSTWKNGEIKGLVARGNFVVDMKWDAGNLIAASLLSNTGGNCKIKYGDKEVEFKTTAGKKYNLMKLL